MARISNKDKALAYAAEHGIILTVEDDMSVFDPDSNTYTVEVWSLRAHLSETGSDCHTYFAHGTTEPRAWADALAYMERLTECSDDCPCRDSDQDTDQDQDQDQDDTLTMANHQDHYQNRSNKANVWVCECCTLMVNNGDESSCRDFHGHTHPTCDKSVIYANTEDTFEVGYNCNGCGVRTGGILYAAIRQTN